MSPCPMCFVVVLQLFGFKSYMTHSWNSLIGRNMSRNKSGNFYIHGSPFVGSHDGPLAEIFYSLLTKRVDARRGGGIYS